MSSSRVLCVDDLSEPQLRRLAAIMQISHPDAVAYALALIDASDNHIDVAESEEKEETSADVSKLQVDTQSTSSTDVVDPACLGETENIVHGDFIISPSDSGGRGMPSEAPGGSNAPGTPLQEGAAGIVNLSDAEDTVTKPDGDGFVEFTESPSQEGFEIPVVGEGKPVEAGPQTNLMAIPEVMSAPVSSDEKERDETRSAPEQDSPAAKLITGAELEEGELKPLQKNADKHMLREGEVQDIHGEESTATSPLLVSVKEVDDEAKALSSVQPLDAPLKEDHDDVDVQAKGETTPDPELSNETEPLSKHEETGEDVNIDSRSALSSHAVDNHARVDDASLLQPQSIPDLESTGQVVSMALSTSSEGTPSVEVVVSDGKKQKKRPPSKKRPSRPQLETPGACAEYDDSLQPVDEEATAVTKLSADTQDLKVTQMVVSSSEEQVHNSAKLVKDADVDGGELKLLQNDAKINGLHEAQEKVEDEGTSIDIMLVAESSKEREAISSLVETAGNEVKVVSDAIAVQAAGNPSPDPELSKGSPLKHEESAEVAEVPTVSTLQMTEAQSVDKHGKDDNGIPSESQSIPDLETTGMVVSMALSTNSESAPSVEVVVADGKKQKKRPPGKKRPSQPQIGIPGAGAEYDDSLLPVDVGTTKVANLPTDAQDSQVAAASTMTKMNDATETKKCSSEEQESPSSIFISEETVHPSHAQTEQLEIEVTLEATESYVSEGSDVDDDATHQEEKKSSVDPPETRPSGKKRPPSKTRPSDGNNDVQYSPSASMDPPGHRNDNVQASGAAVHEVLAWQSDRADGQTEDAFGCFFDGYAVTSRADDDLTANASPEAGCYLLYDSEGGGKLVLHYSKTKISQAVGFFIPGEGYSIQGFKFTRNHGRVELIGNCASGIAGRRNYYSGVCQYIRAAKDVNATLWIYPPTDGKGLDVDVYVYLKPSLPVSSVLLPENQPCCVSEVEAVACLPKHAEFFSNERVAPSKWIEMGNSVGVTIQLPDGKKPVPATEGLFIPGTSESPRREGSLPPWPPSSPQGSAEETGCYLVYDASGCRLMQHYSKTRVAEAVAFFAPGSGQKIPAFKFKSNQGRSSLIGNCSGGVEGRKRYYSGWCQFVRAAKAAQGTLWLYPRNTLQGGLAVDIYVYTTKPKPGAHQTVKLHDDVNLDVNAIDAVACLPRHAEFFEGLTMDLTRWVEEASQVGAAIQL